MLIQVLMISLWTSGVFPSAETENTLRQNVFLGLVAASVLVALVTRILRGRAERAPAPAPEQN